MTSSPPPRRRIVIVSGAPGSGKSTVGTELARELGLAFIAKDTIKEALFDALDGAPGDAALSRRLSAAAMAVLWAVARTVPAAVLDANFRPHSADERGRLEALQPIVEVYCECPPGEAARRFAARARSGRHAAHPLMTLSDEMLAEYGQPVGIGPVVRVNTTEPVDLPAIAERVRAAWSGFDAPSLDDPAVF